MVENILFRGTVDFEWMGGINNVISTAIEVRYNNGTVSNRNILTSNATSYDGSVTYVSYASSYATYKFNTAGYYCINGTWKNKSANSTENVQYDKGILWFSDHQQH